MNKEIESVIHSVGFMYFFRGCYKQAKDKKRMVSVSFETESSYPTTGFLKESSTLNFMPEQYAMMIRSIQEYASTDF